MLHPAVSLRKSLRTAASPAGLLTLLLSMSAAGAPNLHAQTAHSTGSTDFGGLAVGSSSAATLVTFTFDTAGPLGGAVVLTKGAPGLDFTNAGTGSCTAGQVYAAGDTCTVDVTFKPIFAGERDGAVELIAPHGGPIATAYVHGIGVGPQVAFSGLPTPVISKPDVLIGVAVDGMGNLYIADVTTGSLLT